MKSVTLSGRASDFLSVRVSSAAVCAFGSAGPFLSGGESFLPAFLALAIPFFDLSWSPSPVEQTCGRGTPAFCINPANNSPSNGENSVGMSSKLVNNESILFLGFSSCCKNFLKYDDLLDCLFFSFKFNFIRYARKISSDSTSKRDGPY